MTEAQKTQMDWMREANDEFLAWSLMDDSKDMLYAVRDMTPAQRQAVLPDLMTALANLSTAIKECQ